ncbi:MAG: hypothetical protein RLN87_08975 [Parasphingopyxis sp.]|uniref:hypothetical protein n=1 Tax=Parasphingopyxis sp. TaxID=1920299 RepID=UPI0032ED4613
MPSSRDHIPDFGDAEDLREEMVRIFAARQFRRSPVMRKLFGFLVSETLAGRGDRLKAYTIAVDALGKPPTFDAQSDAYPRVQVGRLRGLLDEFYEENGESGPLRFAIPKGGYAVSFGTEEEAPTDETGTGDIEAEIDATQTDAPMLPDADRPIREQLRLWRLAASVFAAIALVLAILQFSGGRLA